MFLGVALVNLFVLGLAGIWLQQSRKRITAEAVQSTRNLAHSLAINVSGALDKIDLGLTDVAVDTERQLASGGIRSAEVQACLVRQKGQIRDVEDLWIADEHGDIRWGTQLPPGKPVNIADRDYFQRLQATAQPGLVLSKPVMGRVTKAWSMLGARRINRPDGSLAGVVLGSLRIEDYFTSRFATYGVGRWGRITLRDEDLALVTRYPREGGEAGRPGSRGMSPTSRVRLALSPEAGSYRGTPPDDGIERFYSYQKVGG
jgi:hypothetical protein